MKTQQDLIRELAGTTCQCGYQKQARQTFCKGCYFALPRPMRQSLYRQIGNGYEKAYDEAKRFLNNMMDCRDYPV